MDERTEGEMLYCELVAVVNRQKRSVVSLVPAVVALVDSVMNSARQHVDEAELRRCLDAYAVGCAEELPRLAKLFRACK